MPSRQDQLHSYQYSMQRVVAALVTHDPDPARSPLRRAGTTALVSLLIASIAVGAVGLYGTMADQGPVDVADPRTVLQEKGTGARFVYQEADGKLHPVLNYASGLLLTTADSPQLTSVSTEKLASLPLGAPLGIPGAPDSLPAGGRLITDRWSVCTGAESDGRPRTTVLVGDRLTDGTVLAKTGKALLVRDPAGTTFVVFDNRRFTIPADRVPATLGQLNYVQEPWAVSAGWINAIPLGPDLRAPDVPRSGGSSTVGRYRVGELVTDGSGHFAVILPDGQARLTDMQARLMQAAKFVPRDIGGELGQLPYSTTVLGNPGKPDALPATVPALADTPGHRVCTTLPVDPAGADGVRIDPTVPTDPSVAGADRGVGADQADLVHVARGRGAVVAAAGSPGAPADSGTVGVVTDTGRFYPLADRALLGKLGYAGVRPQPVPAQLVALLPTGPSLDPARARQAVPPG